MPDPTATGGGSGNLAKTSKEGLKLTQRIFEEVDARSAPQSPGATNRPSAVCVGGQEQLQRGELVVPDLTHPKVAPTTPLPLLPAPRPRPC